VNGEAANFDRPLGGLTAAVKASKQRPDAATGRIGRGRRDSKGLQRADLQTTAGTCTRTCGRSRRRGRLRSLCACLARTPGCETFRDCLAGPDATGSACSAFPYQFGYSEGTAEALGFTSVEVTARSVTGE